MILDAAIRTEPPRTRLEDVRIVSAWHWQVSGAVVTIKDMAFINGTADPADAWGGGALRVSAGTLEVLGIEISLSQGHQGGAISCYLLGIRD
jgi:hypothetical protein